MSGQMLSYRSSDDLETIDVNDANPLPVAFQPGSIFQQQRRIVTLSSFVRPADTNAYTAGDLIANSTTAGLVAPLMWTVPVAPNSIYQVRRARLYKSSASTTNGTFRLWLFQNPVTVANGDNGAISATPGAALIPNGFPNTLGYISFSTASATIGDGTFQGGTPSGGTEILCFAGDTPPRLYGLVEAVGAYVPTSAEVFTAVLEIWADQ